VRTLGWFNKHKEPININKHQQTSTNNIKKHQQAPDFVGVFKNPDVIHEM